MNNIPPCFIVFEGLDGCGKTTISAKVAENIGAKRITTPPPEFSSLRKIVDKESLSNGLAVQAFYAATVIHASEYAKNLLSHGKSIVIDRYVASTIAYDKVVRESGFNDNFWINKIFADITIPHMTFYLHATTNIRKNRMQKRSTKNKTDIDSVSKSKLLDERYKKIFLQLRKKSWEISVISNESTEQACVDKCIEKLLSHCTKN